MKEDKFLSAVRCGVGGMRSTRHKRTREDSGMRGGLTGSRKVVESFDTHHTIYIFLLTWPNKNAKKRGSLTFRNKWRFGFIM